jgi:nucleoside triphosphate diphosphatase
LAEALVALDEVTRRLRRDCPWDREQDERSIVPHTVEESYELAEAAHSGDDAKMLDELGDVLFQVHFLALLLEERGKGDLARVAEGVTEKLVRRHPHIFGGDGEDALAGLPIEARTPAEVRENWDTIKRAESGEGADPLAGVSGDLPALIYARKLQRRAAGGSDRVDPSRALDELDRAVEGLSESVRAETGAAEAQEQTRHGSDGLYEQIGDLLFAAVEVARSMQVDAEIALRRSADRFRERARQPEAR